MTSTNPSPSTPGTAPVRITFDHFRVNVSDMVRSCDFYVEELGLSVIVEYRLEDRHIVQVGVGGQPPGIELWVERGSNPTVDPNVHIAFSVYDVSATIGSLAQRGYAVVECPYMIGAETVGFVADPDGHLVELNDFRGRGIAEAGSRP